MAVTDWILGPAQAVASPGAGGKARALARAEAHGLPVPPWFVVSTEAFEAGSAPELTPAIRSAIDNAVRRLSPAGELLAVRSSASDEDGTTHSFAGQLESFLNVAPQDVAERVRDVWHSGFSDRALAYRRENGLPPISRTPGVIVQRMVAPGAAGVAFGADPVSGRRGVAVVSAVRGLGTTLVSGERDADTWHVDRTGAIIDRRITADRPILSDEEVRDVVALVRAAGRAFGRPQDIEWAIADRLLLLQSRPITSLVGLADPDARLTIWDNSNIVESYSGVTTPLTFSFAREIYDYVYRQFCRMMGVAAHVIAREDDTFRNMLGLIRGRMFYNLLSWYRVLALLPGYHVNRRFMEQMMGVKEGLPDELSEDIVKGTSRGQALDTLHLARTIAGLVANHLTLNRQIDAFYLRLDRALVPPAPPLEDRRIDELVAHYRDLRGQLLLRWDAPLVNDFFAMVFYGLLRNLVIRWCGASAGTLQNDLISGEGGMVSAEPAIRIQQLAKLASPHPWLIDWLTRGTKEEVRAAVAGHVDISRLVDEYLEKFGDRTINELKLESATLHDDPLPLYRAIGSLAQQHGARGNDVSAAESPGDRLRRESRQRVREALAAHPIRRVLFSWVLRHAQRRVRDRENLRLQRTRLFGRVRRIFLEIGRRLNAADLLDDPRDIFYLEVEEVCAFVDGRTTTTDLRALANLRKREFAAFAEGPPPDDRFETRGAVHQGNDFRRTAAAASRGVSADERSGLGCSPGIVRGPVRVISDPTTAQLTQRAILVAEHTDPGWIMIFPSARGVLVERGSLLSHAAIVARELGIPAVVSLPGLTHWLKDGDWVEMDGSAGTVRRIPAEEQAGA